MKPYGTFRLRWLWAALVAVVLALLSVLLVTWRAPEKRSTRAIDSHPTIVGANSEGAHPRTITAPQPGPVRAAEPAVADELCGVKGPDLKRVENETIAQHAMRVTQAAISRWKNALATSEDPRRQAIGMALENAHLESPGNGPKDTPINNSLVLLAIGSDDPLIYALALGECKAGSLDITPGPCQGLSWEHWAHIDPDNAVAWLWLAAKAGRSGDEQGVEDALARASTASRFDGYSSTVTQIALGALPRDAAPLDKAVAGMDVTMTAGIGVPAADITVTLCSDTALEQSRRKRQCTSLANDMADRGTGMFDVAVAAILARKLGFPADQQARLEKEHLDALKGLRAPNPWRYTSDGDSGPRLVGDFRCDTVLGYNRYVDALETAGGSERAALVAIAQTLQDPN